MDVRLPAQEWGAWEGCGQSPEKLESGRRTALHQFRAASLPEPHGCAMISLQPGWCQGYLLSAGQGVKGTGQALDPDEWSLAASLVSFLRFAV